jgi:RNA polymerase sigma-70 factor (ECF subfamily)
MVSKNRKIIEKLYEEHSDELFRYFSFRLRDREKSKDLLQEVFIRMWNSYLSKNTNIEKPRALLFTIAHNLLVNSYERDKKDLSLDNLHEEGFEFKDENQDASKMAFKSELIKNIDDLPDGDSEIIYLRYLDGFSVKEIAEVLMISENVASVRIHRALKKLQEIYTQHE